jgi:prepilin-type N-terminal cleavage/methylation domain-containing protein
MKIAAKSGGFTLVELLIALSILAILTALALPSYREFARRNMVVNEANRLVASLQLARTRALTGDYGGGVCTSSGASAACPTGVPAKYHKGYSTYFVKLRGNAPTIIEFSGELNRGKIELIPSDDAVGKVEFDRLGRIRDLPAISTGVHFTACYEGFSTDSVPGLHIFVARSGRITSYPMDYSGACVENVNQN